MSFQTGCYRRVQEIRLRPVPELRLCLVYRQRPPKLFKLNLSAWLVLELAERGSPEEIAQAASDLAPGSQLSPRAVEHALEDLLSSELIERLPDPLPQELQAQEA